MNNYQHLSTSNIMSYQSIIYHQLSANQLIIRDVVDGLALRPSSPSKSKAKRKPDRTSIHPMDQWRYWGSKENHRTLDASPEI